MIKQAMLYEKREGEEVECCLCAHKCRISSDQLGFCRVRKNTKGVLNTLVYGQAIAANVDPIEKKPLYHFLPGSKTFSIATIGCNFRCQFCQNWQISQVFKDNELRSPQELMPEQVIQEAKDKDCKSISYTYTEPTVFFEYAYDTAKLAKKEGLKNIFVTNGYLSRQALKIINPYLDAVNIDLKSFSEEFYSKNCQGHLQPVLDSIKLARELGLWVEITTLIIPGENDSQSELNNIANFIAEVSKDIPWHLSRFHPDYKFLNQKPTSIESLKLAEELGRKAGLGYVYLGNLDQDSNTYCDNCHKILLRRNYFDLIGNNIIKGKCNFCGKVIGGVY